MPTEKFESHKIFFKKCKKIFLFLYNWLVLFNKES